MCAGCDVDDAVEGVEVGGEGAVVLGWGEEELGEALDGVWWVLCEEGGECVGYGCEKRLDLGWERVGGWRRGVFFVLR